MFELGKKALIISFTMVALLYIVQYFIFEGSPTSEVGLNVSTADLVPVAGLGKKTKPEQNIAELKQLTSLEDVEGAKPSRALPSGKPIAMLNVDGLKYVDKKGRLVALTKVNSKYDFPIISYDEVEGNRLRRKEREKNLREALYLITRIKRIDIELYNRISEVYLTKQFGIIIFVSGPRSLRAIFGHGNIDEKIAYLATIIKRTENTQLIDNAQYLDFRFEDQVVVKKRRSG